LHKIWNHNLISLGRNLLCLMYQLPCGIEDKTNLLVHILWFYANQYYLWWLRVIWNIMWTPSLHDIL
jgi:hypothetical protein